jgi:serine/threonine-protein kinase
VALPPRNASASNAPVLAGRYALRAEIGRGGCAVIFEAHDLRLGRLVALKVVRHDARDVNAHARFAREARACAAIHHPNVCGLSDAGYLEDGRPYLVMERLQGETLASYFRHGGVLTPDSAIDVALQLLSALDTVHALGVVHRDVKPDNVFLVPRNGCGRLVKLLDFGLCRGIAPEGPEAETLTRTGQVVGTPEYMSPEQASGKRQFDARVDIYAVGVILYEALSGRRAFTGKNPRDVVVAVLMRPPPPLRAIRPDIPLELDRIVMRAMAREPSARYASAAQFQEGLLAAKAALDARPPAPAQSGRRVRDRGVANALTEERARAPGYRQRISGT